MKILTLIFTAAMMIYSTAFASENNLVSNIESINTMTADFTQINTIKDFGDDIYSGSLVIKSGEKALWDYYEPFVSWYIFSKDSITQYDGVNNQLIIYEGDQSLSNLLLQILLDIKEAKSKFNITATENTINLEPKEDIGIKNISLKTENGIISEMRSTDNVGNTSKIIFKNVKINLPLSDNAFLKETPKDAEIFKHK